MLNTTVVPHYQGILGPLDPTLNPLIGGDEIVQPLQDHPALPRGNPLNVRGEAFVNKQDWLTRIRMRHDNRMTRSGIILAGPKFDPVLPEIFFTIVVGRAIKQLMFQALRQ